MGTPINEISRQRSFARESIWLMSIPALLLGSGMVEAIFGIVIPPWLWIKTFSPYWPVWIRFGVFTIIVIIIPLIAVLLNLHSMIWLSYDREHHVFHIKVRFHWLNTTIVIIALTVALLFIGHTVVDYVNHSH